jgi:hypothetical protein
VFPFQDPLDPSGVLDPGHTAPTAQVSSPPSPTSSSSQSSPSNLSVQQQLQQQQQQGQERVADAAAAVAVSAATVHTPSVPTAAHAGTSAHASPEGAVEVHTLSRRQRSFGRRIKERPQHHPQHQPQQQQQELGQGGASVPSSSHAPAAASGSTQAQAVTANLAPLAASPPLSIQTSNGIISSSSSSISAQDQAQGSHQYAAHSQQGGLLTELASLGERMHQGSQHADRSQQGGAQNSESAEQGRESVLFGAQGTSDEEGMLLRAFQHSRLNDSEDCSSEINV